MTGLSPFEVVFGRAATLPVDLIFPMDRKEGHSWSNFVENLKLRYSRICEQVCKHQSSGIMRDIGRCQARTKDPFKVGDSVYYFLSRVTRGLSKKLQSRWIGPFEVKRVVSDSLVVIEPQGTWAINAREISTIVSRLRKVDPTWSDSRPSRRYRLDLEAVLDNLDELGENLTYQDDFEDDEEDIRPPVYQGILPAGPPPSREEPHEENLGPDISGEELPTPGSDSQSGNDPTESDESLAPPSIKEETVLEENPTETESNSGSDRPASTLKLNSPRRALLAARAAIHRDSVQGRREERNRRRNK